MSKEEKAMWAEDWKQSGKSLLSYAKENGMNPNTFRGWIKQTSKVESGFVEIEWPRNCNQNEADKIVIEKGAITIQMPLSVLVETSCTILEKIKVFL